VLALLVVVLLAFELQFQLVVEVTIMGCGSTLTATFVRLALGACQDWKWRQTRSKIIAAPLHLFQQAANSAGTPLHTLNKLLV
jgi:hypothetical protein